MSLLNRDYEECSGCEDFECLSCNTSCCCEGECFKNCKKTCGDDCTCSSHDSIPQPLMTSSETYRKTMKLLSKRNIKHSDLYEDEEMYYPENES